MSTTFNYIPATQDGFTLQERDAISHYLTEQRAKNDAHMLVTTLEGEFDMDEAIEWMMLEGETSTYIWAFQMAAEIEMEKLNK